jgi:hypothetical protein
MSALMLLGPLRDSHRAPRDRVRGGCIRRALWPGQRMRSGPTLTRTILNITGDAQTMGEATTDVGSAAPIERAPVSSARPAVTFPSPYGFLPYA